MQPTYFIDKMIEDIDEALILWDYLCLVDNLPRHKL
jgi:hypothetical protein